MPTRRIKISDFNSKLNLKFLPGLPGIMYFWQKTCPYCKEFKPVVKSIGNSSTNIMVYTFECGSRAGMRILDIFGDEYVPVIRYVSKSGKIHDKPYSGPINKHSIIRFIQNKSSH